MGFYFKNGHHRRRDADRLPADKMSGLKQAVRVLKDVEGIGICELTDQDVVRHVMVQRIIKAYADYEAARNEKRKK